MTNSSRFSKTKRKTEVPVKFEVEYEVHELRKSRQKDISFPPSESSMHPTSDGW